MRAVAAWLLLGAASAAAAEPRIPLLDEVPGVEAGGVLGPDYPLDGSGRFHVALLHWLDSLADLDGPGATAGKTVPAHREEFRRHFGPPDAADAEWLRRYVAARRSFAASGERDGLTLAFLESPSLAQALERMAAIRGGSAAADLRRALAHFGPKYRTIWNDGHEARLFLARAEDDSRRRVLGRFLRRVAAFFDVPLDDDARPQLHLVPVPEGHGTHAQALGRHLLIEIRPGEGLLDEVAPIVHENAHYLFYRMDARRRAALERRALDRDATEAWRTLLEALPTAIAQGVAASHFLGERRAHQMRWYHTEIVDTYARALYPLVRRSLTEQGTFDRAFLDRALTLWPAGAAAAEPGRPLEPTRRSP